MENEKVRIAVISMNDGGAKFYHLLNERFKEVTIEFYKTIGQFKKECGDKKYTGIIIDMYTIVSASTEEKGFFFSLQKGLPVMQMKHELQPHEISGFIDPKKSGGAVGNRACGKIYPLKLHENTAAWHKVVRKKKSSFKDSVFIVKKRYSD